MTDATHLQSPRQQLLAALPVKEDREALAGIPTAILRGGEGRPVVLLHGPMGYGAHWMGIIPGLARDHSVVVPDLPGHGASGTGNGPLNGPRVLEWLAALIEHTCRTPPVLVGQLLGGAIALRFAVSRGELLERLVLVDTLGLTPFQPPAEFGQALMRFQATPSADTHEDLWRHCAFDLDGLRERMGERWNPFAAYNVEGARAAAGQGAVQDLMQAFGMTPIAIEDLARIRVPTNLIWGRHDRATPLAVAEAAAERYGWPLEVIEGANDDPPVEQAEAVLRALRAAMRRDERVCT